MAGPSEPPPTQAPILRCHQCNVELIIVTGKAPEKCPDCGRPMEKRGMAEVTFK